MRKFSNTVFILVAFLTIFIAFCSLVMIPSSQAQTTTTLTEKGLTLISQVAGIEIAQYTVSSVSNMSGTTLSSLQTQGVKYVLESNGSKMQMFLAFNQGSIRSIYVLENTGKPHMTSLQRNLVSTAKEFLHNYQQFSGNPFYGNLEGMLGQENPVRNNSILNGHMQFNTTIVNKNSSSENYTTFTWYYVANGICAPFKSVSLTYENGFFKNFVDTWNQYPVGSTAINISQQQAENIALKNAKLYTWTVGWGKQTNLINNFNITGPMSAQLVFREAADVIKSNNTLEIYPVWRIGVGLDKCYPGNVYGIYVDIWADTGDVRDMEKAESTIAVLSMSVATIAESSTNNSTPITTANQSISSNQMILLTTCSIGLTAVFLLVGGRAKMPPMFSLKLRKRGKSLICLLLGFIVLSTAVSAVPTASASRADSWANTHTGSPGGHTSGEISLQQTLCGFISSWEANCGYSSNNRFGTTYGSVFFPEMLYSPSTTNVWFDHGIGYTPLGWPYDNEFHYMVCDSNNDFMFDYQIFQATPANNNYFSYISTCMSADLNSGSALDPSYTGTYGLNNGYGESGNIIGMPFAWTHRLTTSNPSPNEMSIDGFWSPDPGAYCYIGFPWGSPALEQTLSSQWSSTYAMFVYSFFDYALNWHFTVHDALNSAANDCFSPQLFFNCPP